MAIRESLLDALNSIATSDFVRSVTSAGASSKVTVSNLAKAIIENYTASSLGGSTRSVKSAIDAIQTAVDSNTQGTITTCTKVADELTFGSQNKALYLNNRLVQVTVVFTLSASVAANTALFTVPKAMRIAGIFNCRTDNGGVYLIGSISDLSSSIYCVNNSMPSGNYRTTFTYIASADE